MLLGLSAKRPHKNLLRLLEALALIPAERRPVLVIPGYRDRARGTSCGARAPRSASRTTCASSAGSTTAELEGLYALAACFVFPSLYEGFGLPVLEAMRAACRSPAPIAARCPRWRATRR